ncbi:MAG: carbohydrate binding family 9 domain-containing protein [Thermoanaerobaculia bacterium]|nr:carbohydrate binding family 9 domain-containing protein [Thermoanaerobaculia bacterium]
MRVFDSIPARRPARGTALRCFAFALLASPLAALAESAESPGLQLRAFRATAPIRVDGLLDEAIWQEAEVVALAYETAPGENRPAPIATTCRLLYDSERLYVGCNAADPHPEEIRARFTDRDQAYDGDFVGVRLDPFLDRRRSFEFYVNPLGVQMDLFRDDLAAERQGGDDSEDISWDALWDSAGRITAGGFEVELAIPFSSLRFPPGSAAQTWGIGFSRVRPRRDRLELASEPFDRNRNCSVCQLSTIAGFAGVTPGRHLELDPTLTIQRAERRAEVPDGPLEAGEVDVEAGLTATWGVTPDIILSGTVNPDFSQVEADALELDVNQQFAIFYPERRPFFLEGADIFTTPFQVVFTRNVADPDWGAKVTGKRGASAFGAFVAEDARTSLLIPGSQRSALAELPFASTNAVARYRRDLGVNSALGVVATSREGSAGGAGGDYSNQVAGLDGLFRLGAVDSLRVQALGSRTEYPDEIVHDYDQPAGALSDHALYVSYNHDSRNWRLSAAYEDIGRDFRADLGFLPQVDRRYGKALAERTWWAAPEAHWIRFSLGVDSARTDDQAGDPLERLNELWFIFRGRRESTIFTQVADRERTIGGRTFDELYVEGQAEIRPSGALELHLGWNIGDDVDLEELRPAEQVTLSPGLSWSPGRHLRAELEHRYQRLTIDEGWLFTAQLTELRLVWQFNLRSFARVILQHRDLARDADLYSTPVDETSRRLFSQLLYSYRINPQTVFYLGYSDTELETDRFDTLPTDRTLFVKLGYAWLP